MAEKWEFARTIRTLVAAGVATLMLLPPGARAAAGKTGAEVWVVLKSAGGESGGAGGEVAGELVAVRQDALVIGLEGEENRTVAVADIARIRVHRRSKAMTGGIIGAAAGGVAGVLYSAGKSEPGGPFLDGLSEGLIVGGCAALLGGAIGVMIGGQFGGDKTYDLATMRVAEIDKMMAALRKRARIKDYR